MNLVSQVVAVKESVEAELLKRPGVTGVDVGYKEVKGKPTGELAIRVLVADKKPANKVPEDQKIPPEVNGIKTDVIQRRFVLFREPSNRMRVEDISLLADTNHYDPLTGGISIGPCRSVGGYVFAGTLGAIVKDNATGSQMLLSNFHVMCVDNGWHVGDQMSQPSLIDTGGCPTDVVGTLQRAVLSASVDGALCSVSARTTSCSIQDIGDVAGTATATLNMAVRKRGRTTGLTYGTVDSISLSVNIDYGDGLGVHTLTNQIGIRPDTTHNPKFGDHGDSGSVVVDNNRNVVGLHFAGDDTGDGIANPIAAVLSELDISLCVPVVKIKENLKELKDAIKEGKREKVEVKEFKVEKREIKEFKIEKFEIKERKPEKFEFEGKTAGEIGPVPPITPAPSGAAASLEQRVAQLEALIGQLQTFITPGQRPELGAGALAKEGDVSPADLSALSQQLAAQAAAAVQAKVDFDKPAER